MSTTSVSLLASGGTAPYVFSVVAGSGTTIPASITGSTLTVDSTSLEPGTYAVEVRVTDTLLNTFTKSIEVDVLDQLALNILNRDVAFQPIALPFSSTITLASVGGSGTITWALLPSVTTLPGAVLSGTTVSFTVTAYGEWALGIRATDSLGNTKTRVITVAAVSTTSVSVKQGHTLIQISPQTGQAGTHQFTLTVADSAATSKKTSFNYTVDNTVSILNIPEDSVGYYWSTTSDDTEVVFPVEGDANGFQVGSSNPVTGSNGITAATDPTTDTVSFSGPPTGFGNSEIQVPLAIFKSGSQVATIAKTYTTLAFGGNGTATPTIGTFNCHTRPYIVGEFVGLNPQRPYYNSPSVFKNNSYTVKVATGSALPTGLSLDSVTGLVYGYVLDNAVLASTLQYVDSSNNVQGTINITWDIVKSQFQLVDFIVDGQLQVNYTTLNNYLLSTSSASLVSTSVYRGTLPSGLSLGISTDGTKVQIGGAPTTAGWTDLWIMATDANGQVAYYHKRLVVDYISPLTILTDSLQRIITSVPFTQTLMACGGTLPYTWAITAGTLPPGITLNASSGVLSGTTAASYNQVLTIQVTDGRGVTTTVNLPFAVNNILTIVTPALPLILPGSNYAVQLQAEGGITPYTWILAAGSPALPSGFTISPGGLLAGATSLSVYSENITVQVTDSVNSTVPQAYALNILGITNLTIDQEGIGPIIRGSAYHGTLSLLGNGVAPYTWTVTTDSPNPLPAGLALTSDVSDNGATATLAGTTTADLYKYSVKIKAVDANGNTAYAFLFLSTDSSLIITTTSLPQATVGGNYSTTLLAQGYNTPFTWTTSPAPPGGMSLSSAGVFYGVPTTAATTNLVFRVTDSIGDYAIATLPFVAKASTLTITTVPPLPVITAGLAYSTTLTATETGTANPVFTWSVSPNSASLLPTGISLNATTGVIAGTSFAGGFSQNVIFRVTDQIGVYREITSLITVAAAVTLSTGPDYTNGTSTLCLGGVALGAVDTEPVRPSYSFFIVAQKCISASQSGVSLTVPAGFSASVFSYTSVGGGYYMALFLLSGAFPSASPGTRSFPVTVNDSGVSVSATFNYVVYSELPIGLYTSAAAQVTTFSILEGTLGTLYLCNTGGNSFTFPTISTDTKPNTSNLPSLATVSGSNQSVAPFLSLAGNGTSYSLTYAGNNFPPNISVTGLTFIVPDIAWFNAGANAADIYQYTASGGGGTCQVALNFLTNPSVSAASPTSFEGNGGSDTITVSISPSLSPSQSNTTPGFYGTGGLVVTGSTAILDANGFTTGWTVNVNVPTVAYDTTATVGLYINASGPISYLTGSSIATVNYVYPHLTGLVASITLTGENRTQETSSFPPPSATGVYNLSYESSFQDASGVNIDKWDVTSTANNNTTLFYQWAKVIYYITSIPGGNPAHGGSFDMNGLSFNVWLGAHVTNGNNQTINVAIGLLSQDGITWSPGPSTFVINNNNIVNGIYHGMNVSITVPTTTQSGYGGNGTNLTAGTFDPTQVAGIVFFINPVTYVDGSGDGAIGGLFVGAPDATFPYWHYS